MIKSFILELVYQMGQDVGCWFTYARVSSTGLHSQGYLRYPLKASTYNIWPVLFRTSKQDALRSLRWHQLRIFRKLNHSLFDSQEGSVTV